eukprot:scaffold69671_cov61-Cyclotella_meneghiniana.AAC.2
MIASGTQDKQIIIPVIVNMQQMLRQIPERERSVNSVNQFSFTVDNNIGIELDFAVLNLDVCREIIKSLK